MSQTLFAKYKPDPFYYNTQLRPAPSHRHFYELNIQLPPSQSSNDSYGAATPSGGRKFGYIQFECF